MHNRRLATIAAVALLAAACSETKPDCKGTAQVCGGSCVELKSDNLNCGSCGTSCGVGQVCSNGACAVSCAAGLVNCGGHCINPSTDRNFCGASGTCVNPTAGRVCTDGQLCSAGQCVQTCSDAQATCPAASPTYCADLTRDTNNCGACGTTCLAGQQCMTAGGATACACPTGTPDACGTGASAYCTNNDTDPLNCGACGNVCAAGKVCSAGSCVQTCSAAEATACPAVNPTYCANTVNDSNNCGACGTVCAAGQQCSGGICSCPAATPSACTTGGGAGFCANLTTDSLNCGACGAACGVGQVCVSGACILTCAGGATKCGGSCVDTKIDTANCGACGTACPAGQVCSNSTCALACAGGSTKCGNACVDTRADVANCGGCAVACSAGQVCANGTCALSCAGGSTKCGATCVDTRNDPANCGGCNVACGAGQVCSNGACGNVCPVGEYACAGKCIDPRSDPNYCGAAADCSGGAVCGADQACSAGICRVLVPTCIWTQVASHDLTNAPLGSFVRNGAAGGQGAASTYGRTAWYQTSDWNELIVPLGGATAEDVFAIEAEVFIPAFATYGRHASIMTHRAVDGTHGIGITLTSPDPSAKTFNWWNAAGFVPPVTPLAFATDGWQTVRLEGRRSACVFRARASAVVPHAYPGTCDLTGDQVYLTSNASPGPVGAMNVAWSNLRIFKGSAECAPPLPASCADVQSNAPGSPSGVYTIDPDGPGGAAPYTAYCDMTTAGGGWTLALAYDHPAGGTAATVPGTVPVDPSHGYSHLSAAQLAALPFTSMRFYCQTSLHPRKIDAIFGSPGAVAYIKGLGSTQVSDWTSFTALPIHTANLPAATANVDLTIPLNSRIAFEPFFRQFNYHWNIAGTPTLQRFECDDYANGPANATLHQVWVR